MLPIEPTAHACWPEAIATWPNLSSQILLMVIVGIAAVFVTLTVYVNCPPGSGRLDGLASFVTVMLPFSTTTGTWNKSSHTHFDLVSGAESNALLSVRLQAVPELLCQLVQLGRFRKPSPSVS